MAILRIYMSVMLCLCCFTFLFIWFPFTPVCFCKLAVRSGMEAVYEVREEFSEVMTPAPPRTVYVITATYPRQLQIPELTRLGQTLKLVPDLTWLVIEDANSTTELVARLLQRLGIPYVHLTAPMPEEFQNITVSTNKPRGVSNRNRGLEWLRANASSGVLFFADDDNTYDVRLFEEMRDTRRVSMWPVGFMSLGVASPVVRDGKVTGFYDGWYGKRVFSVDMAQFAVSVEFLLQRPQAIMPYKVGYEEDGFLKSLSPFNVSEIEPKASNCTECDRCLLKWVVLQSKKAA